MDRRQFLRWLAGLGSATAAAALVGCDRPDRRDPEGPVEPDPHPDPLDEATGDDSDGSDFLTRLAVVHTGDRAEGIHRAAELLDHDFRDQEVFLKPNFNSADPPPGSTHNDALRALVQHLHSQRVRSITVGDRSGMGDTREVMRKKQIFTMADAMDFDTVVFDELDADQWELIVDEKHHWSRGFALPVPVLEADAYVQTCCLKTHRFGGHFTMALKNNVGLVARTLPDVDHNFMEELHNSDHQRRMIAEINTAINHDLIVLDAIEGFYEEGPEAGPTARFDTIVAGTDPVAVDAVGIALLRRHGTTPEVSRGPIAELDQIARAIELGVGTADPDEIDFLTADSHSESLVSELVDLL